MYLMKSMLQRLQEIGLFQEMQTFMYAVFEEHLKMDIGMLHLSPCEVTRDAQSIYKELKKHAKSSTAALTSACFPGNWRGRSYAFVLH
jgi:hypothetical protein